MSTNPGQDNNGTMPLSFVRPGARTRVARIDAGCGLLSRLSSLGLVPGTPVEVITANGGPLVLSVLGSRIMLGQGMASKVFVRELKRETW